MDTQIVDHVRHIFTLEWALWALPISLILSILSNRAMVSLILAVIAVVVHHIAMIALPVMMSGGDTGTLPDQIAAMVPTLDPIALVAEFVAYAFMIIIFSLTRRDMFRPSVYR